MKDWPQPIWACFLAALGSCLAIAVYIIPGDVTSRQAAFQIASALVTGALGAFAGHATTANSQKGMIINNPPDITASTKPNMEDSKSV
jgi:hypothetical protein